LWGFAVSTLTEEKKSTTTKLWEKCLGKRDTPPDHGEGGDIATSGAHAKTGKENILEPRGVRVGRVGGCCEFAKGPDTRLKPRVP